MKACLTLLGLLLLPSFAHAETATPLTADELFDPNRLVEVRIELAERDWDVLRLQARTFATALRKPTPPRPYDYFRGSVTIDGVRIEDVGIRKKGFIGSQDSHRPSLKIKFTEFKDQAPVAGLDRLTLNNNKQDRSLVSQFLTYKLFREAELPASRCNLAKVWVNGRLLGVYSNVESVKKPMLKRIYGDDSGKLYEGTLADFFVDKVQHLESKTGDDENRDELLAVARLLADNDDVDLEALGKYIDIDEFTRFWAMESLIGFWDGYTNNQNNYFVYYHTGDSKFHFLPWGADCALSNDQVSRQFRKGPESVYGQSMIANRLYWTDGFPERYRTTLESLMDSIWNEDAINAEIDRIQSLVEGHTHASQADVAKGMDTIRRFVRDRRKTIARELGRWPVKIGAEPREPFEMQKIGTVEGTFSTTWTSDSPRQVYDIGEAELKLTLNGEVVRFIKLGVHATIGAMPGPDGKKPPSVVFVGKRESNKIRLTLGISTNENDFLTNPNQAVAAQGMLIEGNFFAMLLRRVKFKMLGGTITFDQAGMKPGDVVRGTINMEIMELDADFL